MGLKANARKGKLAVVGAYIFAAQALLTKWTRDVTTLTMNDDGTSETVTKPQSFAAWDVTFYMLPDPAGRASWVQEDVLERVTVRVPESDNPIAAAYAQLGTEAFGAWALEQAEQV